MGSAYDQIAVTLAALRSDSGGTREQRCATASLLYSSMHYEFVELARALRRQDFEVSVYEDATSARMRMNGATVSVERFSSQSEIKIEFYGFHSGVVPAGGLIRDDVPLMPAAYVLQLAQSAVRDIGLLWREELAARGGKRP